MNKKFLSAILFGALMVTSTGTFVSCKDYDEDIEGLQTQINANKDAIAKLQQLVGSGNWVTSVAGGANGLVVTMSNGSSVTIEAANGKDGKNGTEWTIGEDGFWYMDGEKTENVAVAKDGVNGLTAPSPSISADGNWVVYTFDAAKGEFVANETEISAAGESAYVVKVNGVYELHIADANGEFQTVALAGTCDSFVVEAPYKEIHVGYETATWKKWAASVKTDAGKALLAKYPELAEIKKDAQMEQGGLLPLIVSPSAVELTNDYKFSLQTPDGKIADVKIYNPVKGLVDNTIQKYTYVYEWTDANGNIRHDAYVYDYMYTRSAENAGHWGLAVDPAYDKKNGYVNVSNASLVVENENGVASRTPFVYSLSQNNLSDSEVFAYGNRSNGTTNGVKAAWSNVPYAESIDLFAGYYNKDNQFVNAPIRFYNDYKNHYIIALNDALDVEKYGLSIAEDGHTLNIAKMPETDLSIEVELKVVSLGLNGSIEERLFFVTVGQEIAATGALAEQNITLAYDAKKESYEQLVTWKIEDLKFTATQLDQFLNAYKTLAWSYVDADGVEHKNAQTIEVKAYDKDGEETSSYKDAVTFGFVLDASKYVPAVYDIRLEGTTNGNTVVYAAETTMTVKNPELTAIKLISEYVENGVLQAVGEPNAATKTIIYDFLKGLILADDAIVSNVTFFDVENEEYKEINGEDAPEDAEEMASVNWITGNKLVINAYDEEKAEDDPAHYNQLGQVRKIRAAFNLFGNGLNIDTFDFEVKVKSAVYSETPAEVVTITPASLTLPLFDSNTADAVDPTKVDIKTITTAVLAYGPNAGKKYTLWNTGATEESTGKNTYNKYASWKTIADNAGNKYVANANNLMVEIANSDLAAFGYTADEIIKIQKGDEKAYILASEVTASNKVTWAEIWAAVKDLTATVKKSDNTTEVQKVFVNVLKHGSTTDALNAGVLVKLNSAAYNAYLKDNANTDAATYLKLWNTYSASIAYDQQEEEYTIPATQASGLSAYLTQEAYIEMVDPATGKNFVSWSEGSTTIKASLATGVDMTTDEVEVKFNLVISDVWGMTMKVPFTVTVTK